MLAAACVVVPWIFTIRLFETFSIPKLVSLWVVLAVAGLLVVLGKPVLGRKSLGSGGVDVPGVALYLFLLLNLLSFAFSVDHRQSLIGERLQYQGLLTTVLYAGYFAVARMAFDERRRVRLLLASVAIGATVVAAYALLQKAGLDPIWQGYLPDGRVFSTIGQPNALAAYLVLAIPLALALLSRAGPPARAAVLLAIGMMVVALVLTSSRGGYVGAAVGLGILGVGAAPANMWRRVRRGLRPALNVGIVVVSVTLIAVAVLPAARSTAASVWRGIASVGDVVQEQSARRHLEMWYVGVHIALDRPLVGAGPDTYALLFPRYKELVLPEHRARVFDPYRVESPHNNYIAIAAGSGLPALVAYAVLVGAVAWAMLREARRAWRPERVALFGMLGAMGGHVLTDSFMTADVTASWLFWLLMGAGLASARAIPSPQHGRTDA